MQEDLKAAAARLKDLKVLSDDHQAALERGRAGLAGSRDGKAGKETVGKIGKARAAAGSRLHGTPTTIRTAG